MCNIVDWLGVRVCVDGRIREFGGKPEYVVESFYNCLKFSRVRADRYEREVLTNWSKAVVLFENFLIGKRPAGRIAGPYVVLIGAGAVGVLARRGSGPGGVKMPAYIGFVHLLCAEWVFSE